jgi:AraC-like DNA-binding protein
MRAVYVRPERCPIDWPHPTPVAAEPLLAQLIRYLADVDVDAARRTRAEAVLIDLLEPVPYAMIQAPVPDEDGPARDVARALLTDPADPRTLDQWGHEVGASGRTLARAFLAGTGVPFGRWRTAARLQAALPLLAAGESIAAVARRVGYETPSAFVAAFHRETGLTPGGYFRSGAGSA